MSIQGSEDLMDSGSELEEIVSMGETRKFVKKLEIQIDILRKIIDPEKSPSAENRPEIQDHDNEN